MQAYILDEAPIETARFQPGRSAVALRSTIGMYCARGTEEAEAHVAGK